MRRRPRLSPRRACPAISGWPTSRLALLFVYLGTAQVSETAPRWRMLRVLLRDLGAYLGFDARNSATGVSRRYHWAFRSSADGIGPQLQGLGHSKGNDKDRPDHVGGDHVLAGLPIAAAGLVEAWPHREDRALAYIQRHRGGWELMISVSSSVNKRDRIRKRCPVGASKEKPAPRPGTMSIVRWVCDQ